MCLWTSLAWDLALHFSIQEEGLRVCGSQGPGNRACDLVLANERRGEGTDRQTDIHTDITESA